METTKTIQTLNITCYCSYNVNTLWGRFRLAIYIITVMAWKMLKWVRHPYFTSITTGQSNITL